MTLIDDIKRDREAGTPGDWQCLEEGVNSWSITPECNSLRFVADELCNVHDARRIARVPRMEAALLAAEECERVLTAMANRVSLYSGGHDDKLVNDAEEAITAFRKTLGEDQ